MQCQKSFSFSLHSQCYLVIASYFKTKSNQSTSEDLKIGEKKREKRRRKIDSRLHFCALARLLNFLSGMRISSATQKKKKLITEETVQLTINQFYLHDFQRRSAIPTSTGKTMACSKQLTLLSFLCKKK